MFAFGITVPGSYIFVDEHGKVGGILDGTPLEATRELAAGHHDFVAETNSPRIALFWARAFEKGYSPSFDDEIPGRKARAKH